ncbi:MAG TPA: NmrA family NAD(P)-binding protein [Thermoanaerobaculia bacterium]|nr:NmrA family NAD(P)-binding protein [Thermoanaerobaculia bacterium]
MNVFLTGATGYIGRPLTRELLRRGHTVRALVRPSSVANVAAFRSIDLVSIRESISAARAASIGHFIYLSVAMPAPAMKAYVAVREEGERLVRALADAAERKPDSVRIIEAPEMRLAAGT